MEGNALK